MTFTTKSGKTFPGDMAVTSDNPTRLYLGIIDTPVYEVAAAFTNPAELPIDGYPKYTVFNEMHMTSGGSVMVTLAPAES